MVGKPHAQRVLQIEDGERFVGRSLKKWDVEMFKFHESHVATSYPFLIPGTPVAVCRCFADKNKPSLDAT